MGGRPPRKVIEGQLVVVLFSLLQFASANKYCAFEIEGEAKYYVCPRNENCCSIGCCVNLAFHFYQLWYYWLLVIFLFMLCSGGGWWFRFCRSSHSARTPTPSNSSRYSHSHSHPSNGITSHSLHTAPTTNLRASPRPLHYHHHSERTCPHHRHQIIGSNGVAVGHHQRARILHRPCNQQRSSMYYLQRIWKGPNEMQQHQLPPSYSTMFFNMLTNGNAATGPTNTSVVAEGDANGACAAAAGLSARPTNCPYYQLYGPPPSYDSVIQLETGGGGATTSCCLVDPSRIATTTTEAENQVQVNSNQDHGEQIIQEIVISEPLSRSSTELRLNEGKDVLAAAAIPLISAECDAAGRTQPEHYNMTRTETTTSCQGVKVVGEEPAVSSCFVATSSTSGGGMHGSSAARRREDDETAFAAACATSTAHFEEMPSTSSSE